MKLTKRQREDLILLLEHVKQDLSYQEGGTFVHPNDEDKVDKTAVQRVKRAKEWILTNILMD